MCRDDHCPRSGLESQSLVSRRVSSKIRGSSRYYAALRPLLENGLRMFQNCRRE